MPKMKKYFKLQIKQLPFMLGKTVGAIMAAIGFPAAIFILARRPNKTSEILTYFLVGILGIIIFIVCDKLLKRISSNNNAEQFSKENKLAWMIFAALAAIFILVTYIITK